MYEDVFQALGTEGPGPARCPVHDDNRESLNVSEGQRGLVMHCHVGCSVNEIMQALGLPMRALFPPREGPRRQAPRVVATYSYRDELDRELFQVVRMDPKSFRQRRQTGRKHDGSPVFDWKLGDTRRVLWRLPQVLDAIAADETIYVTEGEKDAEAVVREGGCATTNPGGAGVGKWLPDYTTILADAQVIVISDADQAGKEHAARVAAELRRAGGTVSVMEPADGFKDVAEHLGAGKTLDDLKPWNEDQLSAPTPLRENVWLVADFIRRRLTRKVRWAVPGLLRTDSKVVVVAGEGVGKSVLFRELAVGTSQGIHPLTGLYCQPVRSLIIDLENPELDVMESLAWLWDLAEKQSKDFDMDRCAIWHEQGGIDLRRKDDREKFEATLERTRPGLVVMGPAYKMLGGASEGDDDVLRPILNYIDKIKDRYGFGILLEHHAPHGEPGQRIMRPYGTTIWQRWPDLGLALNLPKPGEDDNGPMKDDQGRATDDKGYVLDRFQPPRLTVDGWRGARFKHQWPGDLVHGENRKQQWPWVSEDWPRGKPAAEGGTDGA